jgi:hypothetical protein
MELEIQTPQDPEALIAQAKAEHNPTVNYAWRR